MKTLHIGEVTILSIVERNGPWRKPEDFFAVYDAETAKQHLATLPPIVFDQTSGKLVITYQTFVVKTPRLTVLIDTCAGDHKGYDAPLDYSKQLWLDGLAAVSLTFADITHAS